MSQSDQSQTRLGRRATLAEGDPLPPEDRTAQIGFASIEALYRQERPKLLRCLGGRSSPGDAGDLLQQAFLRFMGLGETRRAAIIDPAGYLGRTAANLATDQARRDRRQWQALHVAIEDVELTADDQLAALEARDILSRLEHALARLKPRTREIFLAHRIDGYSYVEIAARTGLSVKSVEKHMSRAIAYVDRVLPAR